MFTLEIDKKELKELYLQKVDEHIKSIGQEVFFMDSKQLSKFLNMSWNSIVTHFLSDNNFPSIRLGHKWLFPRKDVEMYLEKYYKEVRNNGGDILKYKRKS